MRWHKMGHHTFKIEYYYVSDYLLVSRLLNGDTVSWENAKDKILSSRASNNATSVRKIVGHFECIENVRIDTIGSYYEEYKLNKDYVSHFQDLKMMYESNSTFMNRLNKRLEKVAKFNEVQGSN